MPTLRQEQGATSFFSIHLHVFRILQLGESKAVSRRSTHEVREVLAWATSRAHRYSSPRRHAAHCRRSPRRHTALHRADWGPTSSTPRGMRAISRKPAQGEFALHTTPFCAARAASAVGMSLTDPRNGTWQCGARRHLQGRVPTSSTSAAVHNHVWRLALPADATREIHERGSSLPGPQDAVRRGRCR